MTYFEAFIIALVEGLTEFLPVSSTGHMILTSAALGLKTSPFLSLFIVCIQFGAILSVVVLYWKRFFQSLQFYLQIAYAVIPTAIIALLLKKYIDHALGSVLVVGINLLIGGILILILEKYFNKKEMKEDVLLSPKKSMFIGLFQAISLFPGVSRSAATIYGGMFQGLSRKDAAEFSFFLAVPLMFMATVLDLFDFLKEGTMTISSHEISLLVFGNVIAFIVAALAIKFFISYIVKHGFKVFGYYRIVIGIIVIILYQYFGFSLEMM
jgi:undecaprenyl-diphosphatase